MIEDIHTMIWKETRELLNQGASKTGNIVRQLFIVAFFGIFYPWQMGERFLSGAGPLIALFPILIVITVTITVESFAGERERHTLETLLSTRLSDDAILFGKLSASIVLSCAGMILSLIVSLITINLTHHQQGTLLLFSRNESIVLLIAILLSSTFLSTLAVLISLRSSTVRQAGQTLAFGLIIPFIVGLAGFRSLPVNRQISFLKLFTEANLPQTEIAGVLFAAALIAVMLFIARLRFRRALLVLD